MIALKIPILRAAGRLVVGGAEREGGVWRPSSLRPPRQGEVFVPWDGQRGWRVLPEPDRIRVREVGPEGEGEEVALPLPEGARAWQHRWQHRWVAGPRGAVFGVWRWHEGRWLPPDPVLRGPMDALGEAGELYDPFGRVFRPRPEGGWTVEELPGPEGLRVFWAEGGLRFRISVQVFRIEGPDGEPRREIPIHRHGKDPVAAAAPGGRWAVYDGAALRWGRWEREEGAHPFPPPPDLVVFPLGEGWGVLVRREHLWVLPEQEVLPVGSLLAPWEDVPGWRIWAGHDRFHRSWGGDLPAVALPRSGGALRYLPGWAEGVFSLPRAVLVVIPPKGLAVLLPDGQMRFLEGMSHFCPSGEGGWVLRDRRAIRIGPDGEVVDEFPIGAFEIWGHVGLQDGSLALLLREEEGGFRVRFLTPEGLEEDVELSGIPVWGDPREAGEGVLLSTAMGSLWVTRQGVFPVRTI